MEPMAQDISSAVKHIVRDQLGVSEQQVIPEALLIEDLGALPLGLVELTRAFEKAFLIDIADGDVGKIRTVRDAIDYINRKRPGAR
jgi:acyl carrier protein